MKELKLQKLQNDLRNKFSKQGVKMIGSETIFFFKRYQDWKKCYNRTICGFWNKSKNRK